MALSDFSDVKIVEESYDVKDIIKSIIKTEKQDDAFHVLDVGAVLRRHRLWLREIPRVTPYYAVKCNPDPTVIQTLAKLNGHFDCASKSEIISVMKYGVSGERIIFANPMKAPAQIKFARKVNVAKLTADSEEELVKIKNLFPEAKIVLRFRCDSGSQGVDLGLKYGCELGHSAMGLIQLTKELGLNLYGFSFHVGSPCGDCTAYKRGIQSAKELIDYARSIGCDEACLIDIGGGFPGESDYDFSEIIRVINESIKNIDSSIKIISEPGRYYVTEAITAVAQLFGKKTIKKNNKEMKMYYVNDGAYGSFIEELLQMKSRHPTSLLGPASNKKYISTLWGPTCDSMDCILKNVLLPDYNVGDWMIWEDMGAYSTACATKFNGFEPSKVFPFIRKNDWNDLLADASIHSNGTTCRKIESFSPKNS